MHMHVSANTTRVRQHVVQNLTSHVLLLAAPWFSEIPLSVKHYFCSCFERQAHRFVMNSTLMAVAIDVHCVIEQSIPACFIDVLRADT